MKRTLLTSPLMEGDDVKFAQNLLKSHGDYDGEVNKRVSHKDSENVVFVHASK
jgi:hypothetical protein